MVKFTYSARTRRNRDTNCHTIAGNGILLKVGVKSSVSDLVNVKRITISLVCSSARVSRVICDM